MNVIICYLIGHSRSHFLFELDLTGLVTFPCFASFKFFLDLPSRRVVRLEMVENCQAWHLQGDVRNDFVPSPAVGDHVLFGFLKTGLWKTLQGGTWQASQTWSLIQCQNMIGTLILWSLLWANGSVEVG